MTHQLGALAIPIESQYPHVSSQQSITPVLGCTQYTDIHMSKILRHIK